ncbi:propionate--CoA ligase [Rubrobacter indicoceani]|uniref:propionate--CoA ligase n=1 Tax=Rubrobacter indicoceani TaxID=2051957 RepID=UPI000E5C01FC|nr:propionate--CoA ligase [Rubrobacter indicoceani]
MTLEEYRTFHERSVEDRAGFWGEQAKLIDWHRDFDKVLDYSKPPFTRWFVGGETNLCYNMLDRHLEERGDQAAVVYVSSETDEKTTYTYREVYREVNALAAALMELGVEKGDRVIIYLPMTAQALFAILACVRLGAIHSVVFGGFAAASLARRIDDARPRVMITADGGMRGGNVVRYKPLVDEACQTAKTPPENVIIFNRGLDKELSVTEGRDLDYAELREKHLGAEVPVRWVESSHPSYILYTSGTTGTPKGVQRDTGGYAVALASSIAQVFDAEPGETFFCASDVGWVVGHSYIVYAPLLRGMTTVVYEGLPVRPDAGVWWRIVEEFKVSTMFTSPTAIRALKKQDQSYMTAHDTGSLRKLFLAGEPLDEPTSRWASESLGVSVRDNYWQTETGWPILSAMQPGLDDEPVVAGSAGFACAGYSLQLMHEETGRPVTEPGERGILTIKAPTPPGFMSTVWGDDERFVETYFQDFPGGESYSTFDWATQAEDGRYFIMGRSDDVINVAGHRLGTREIEEAISDHPDVAETAAVGVKDEYKGQEVVAYVIAKSSEKVGPELEESVKEMVVKRVGKIARPSRVFFVDALPKTRSGKMLRRSIQALAEGRDPGDLSTLEDPSTLEGVRASSQGS